MHFVAHGVSHKGKVRRNADRFLVGSIRRSFVIESISDELTPPEIPEEGGPGGSIILVADGIGSSRFGHEAASLTDRLDRRAFREPAPPRAQRREPGGRHRQPVRAETYRVSLAGGDSILLCTDGLTKHVSEETMGSVVSGSASPTEACDELLRLALEGGGKDNITVVVGRVA